jgi:hypothetical protein
VEEEVELMGKYTPAVIVHDLLPYQYVVKPPEWLRPLPQPSSQDHERLVMCSDTPRELRPGSHLDLELWRQARLHVLDEVSVRRLSTISGVGSRAVKKVLDALRLERDVYEKRRCAR